MTFIHDIEAAEAYEAELSDPGWIDEPDFDPGPFPDSDIPEDMRTLLADLFPPSDPSDDLPF